MTFLLLLLLSGLPIENRAALNFVREWYLGPMKVTRIYDHEAGIVCYVTAGAERPGISCVQLIKETKHE